MEFISDEYLMAVICWIYYSFPAHQDFPFCLCGDKLSTLLQGGRCLSNSDPTSLCDAPFQIAGFHIDPRANAITTVRGEVRHLEPKIMRLLVTLVKNANKVVLRGKLIDVVWGVEVGGDESLTRAISLLRKALNDDRGARVLIETIPKEGYRLVAVISPCEEGASSSSRSGSLARSKITPIALLMVVGALIAFFIFLPLPDRTTLDRSVAVLPFTALSSGEEDAYFADGLTEDIIYSLWALSELQVVAAPALDQFNHQSDARVQLAGELEVAHVVEGTIRRAGEKVRVTAKLIRVSDRRQLWARTYDRPIANMLDIQSDIAEQIASALNIVLDEEKMATMQAAGLRNVDAYVPYYKANILQARAHGEAPQIPTLIKANALFQETVRRAPDFFPAYFVQTDLYTHILLDAAAGDAPSDAAAISPETASAEFQELLSMAYDAARSDLERAYVGAVQALFSDDWSDAGIYLDTVLATTSCAIDEQWTQILSVAFGRAEAAQRFFEHTTQCAPLYNIQWINAAMASLYQGHTDEALALIEAGKARVGFNLLLERTRFEVLLAAGRFDEAEMVLNNFSGRARIIEEIGLNAARGERDAAVRVADRLFQESGDETFDDLAGPLGDQADALLLSIAPIVGNRELANLAASRIDARPYGTARLAISTYYCLCGAPFDLEATPNFAAQIKESDLQWPPPAPISYPLKDW